MVILTTSMDWFNMPSRRLTRAILAFRYYLGTLPLLRKRLTLKLREAKACQPPMSLSPRTVPSFRPPKPGVYPCHQGPQEMAKKRGQEAKSQQTRSQKKTFAAADLWLRSDSSLAFAAAALRALRCDGLHAAADTVRTFSERCDRMHSCTFACTFHCTSDFYFLLHCSFLTYSSIHFSHGTCLFTSNNYLK